MTGRCLGLAIDEIKECSRQGAGPDPMRLRPEGAERKGKGQPPAQRISGLVELTAYAGGAVFMSEEGRKGAVRHTCLARQKPVSKKQDCRNGF